MAKHDVLDLVIVGSGPAAWTAALYAARANLAPVVYEGEPSRTMIPGGQLMWTTDVENYPGFPDGIGGQELVDRMRRQAVRFGTEARSGAVRALAPDPRPFVLDLSDESTARAHAVIIATGARANWLGLPNEERLAHSGGGVSACAVCDGALPFFRDKVLAVIGGGDSAMEEALFLTKFAREVVVIHRREELRASRVMADRARRHPKIRFEWNTQVVRVLGDDFITAIECKDTLSGVLRRLDVGGMFVAIGHTPNTAFLAGVVDRDEAGYIRTAKGWRTETSVPGVFAAGDVMDPYYRQAVTAAGTGAMAALEAERWLAAVRPEG